MRLSAGPMTPFRRDVGEASSDTGSKSRSPSFTVGNRSFSYPSRKPNRGHQPPGRGGGLSHASDSRLLYEYCGIDRVPAKSIRDSRLVLLGFPVVLPEKDPLRKIHGATAFQPGRNRPLDRKPGAEVPSVSFSHPSSGVKKVVSIRHGTCYGFSIES
jgi:hypothetical protein